MNFYISPQEQALRTQIKELTSSLEAKEKRLQQVSAERDQYRDRMSNLLEILESAEADRLLLGEIVEGILLLLAEAQQNPKNIPQVVNSIVDPLNRIHRLLEPQA